MITNLKYRIVPGHKFEKLLIIKDRRAHRIRKAKTAAATMEDSAGNTVNLKTAISYEGGVVLSLLPRDTLDLAPGDYTFDVVADPWSYNQTVAQGIITVDAISRITPLEGSPLMQLTLDQYTDFRKVFDWQSADSVTLQISDARMQAKDDQGTVVLDIDFFATPPDEPTIAGLDPDKRGYISPIVDASFELHISDQVVVAPGNYSYDILAKAAGGDWGKVVEGTLVVESSTTNPGS